LGVSGRYFCSFRIPLGEVRRRSKSDYYFTCGYRHPDSFTNTLAACGSRFWQDNWENHIDMLEDEFEGRLYKTVWLDEGEVSYSVSRVNWCLDVYFIVFWVLVFIYVVLYFLKEHHYTSVVCLLPNWWPIAYVIVVIVMIGVAIFWLLGQTTNLRGTIPRADGSRVRIQGRSRWQKRISAESPPFISRNAPGEDLL
jgi:hypothetical protein